MTFLQRNGFFIATFFFVLPFFLLTFYTHPLGFHDWDWAAGFTEEVSTNLTFWDLQSYFYFNTMGRYASTAFSSTLQYWFSPLNYKLFLSLFFISFLGGFYFLIYQMFKGFVSQRVVVSIYTAILCLYCTQLSSPYEAFYNVSCLGTYNLGGLVFMIFVGLICKKLKADISEKLVVSHIALFITGILAVGFNEVILLATNLLLFLLVAGNRYYHKEWNKFFTILFTVVLTFSCIAVFAPGNFTRMEYSEGSTDIVNSLFLTISVSIFAWLRWLSVTPLILFGILYLPIGQKIARRAHVQKFFNYPLLSGLSVLMLQPACLFLLFYSAGGTTFPERYTDLIFLVTLIGILYFLQSCLVALVNKKWLAKNLKFTSFVKVSIGTAAFCSLFFTNLHVNKEKSASNNMSYLDLIKTESNSTQAWLTLLSGKASKYDKGMKAVYIEIEKCSDTICYIPPPPIFPTLIYDKIYDRKALNGGRYIIDYFHGNRERTQLVRYYDMNEVDDNTSK